MKSFFGTTNGVSPVSQDFIWVGEYYDGTHLSEFDFGTGQENSFYGIVREKLIRFGLIGHGSKLFFESDGFFNINGKGYAVFYRDKATGKEYPLTGNPGKYRDIITYKDAESTVNLGGGGRVRTQINQYNLGYKTNLTFDGINFSFKALVKVPFGDPVHFNFRLVADKDIDGVLLLKRVNDRKLFEIEAPLKKGSGGEVNFPIT